MNETIKAILEVVETGTPELQIAAAQILGTLAPRDQAAVSQLEARLVTADDYLVPHLLGTVAAIGSTAAIRVLVHQLSRRDSHGDLAAHLLAEIGDPISPVLAAAFDDVPFDVQVRMLTVLGRRPGAAAIQVLEKALMIPELSDRATDAMLDRRIAALDGKAQKALRTRISKAMKSPELEPECLAGLLRVLAALDPTGSRLSLIKYAAGDQSAVVRHAALQALGTVKLTPKQAESLLGMVQDPDRLHVARPALEALARVETWPESAVPALRKLAASANPELRQFALRAMARAPYEALVKPLTKVLLDTTGGELGEVAAEGLSRNPNALEPLMRAFLLEKDPARARRYARPLRELARKLPAAGLKAATEKGCRLLFAQGPTAEIVLETLLAARPDEFCKLVVEKAVKLRKSRKHHEAVALLAFLAHAEQLDDEGQYQLAVTRLILDNKEGRHDEGLVGDATMGYFARLVRDEFPLFDRLRKEAVIKPEDLLRLGQHFVDAVGPERRFGSELLHHLADKHGRKKAGEEARLALLDESL